MKKIVLLLGLSVVSCAAMANEGAYLQGEGGVGAVTMDGSDGATAALFTSSAGFAGRLSGGYLWGDRNFNYGLEMGLFYYPSYTSTQSFIGIDEERLKNTGYNIDLLGVLKYTFGDSLDGAGFAVFGKAGAAYLHQQLTIDSRTPSFTIGNIVVPATPWVRTYDDSGSKVAPEVALGFGYQFNQNFEIDLTGSAVFAGSSKAENPVGATGALMLGLTYHFA